MLLRWEGQPGELRVVCLSHDDLVLLNLQMGEPVIALILRPLHMGSGSVGVIVQVAWQLVCSGLVWASHSCCMSASDAD